MKDVGRNQDGFSEVTERTEQLSHFHAGPRIQTRCRLIEQQHLGIVQQDASHRQPLAHAPRQTRNGRFCFATKVGERQRVIHHLGPSGSGDAITAGKELQVLPHQHVVVGPQEIGDVSDQRSNVRVLPPHREAADSSLP